MCTTCGCDRHDPDHDHGHDHDHHHDHASPPSRTVQLQADLLAKNDHLAAHNRRWLLGRGILSINLMGSPGAGKTTLLEHTIRGLAPVWTVNVIEGDQATENDAARIRRAGCAAVQINTGTGCHLDANMVRGGLDRLQPQPGSLLVIENVGNLVCPALFDLGEGARVVVMALTEGADKPLKYPHMFRAADLVLVTKMDLAPYLDCTWQDCAQAVRQVSPGAAVLGISATRGQRMDDWYAWLRGRTSHLSAAARPA